MRLQRLAAVFEKLHVLPLAFGAYQRLSGLNPGVYRRNRSHGAAPDGLPIPAPSLLMKVAGSAEIAVFLHGGELAARSIREILGRRGIAMEDVRSLLDFGCGCGRVLRHWHSLPGTEVHGTDYNPELVRWCKGHLPFARMAVNGLAASTGCLDASFDLVYALSVFTHLPEPLQMGWMQEFHRILKPNGLLLLSLHGAYYLPQLNDAERAEFQAGRLVTRYDQSPGTNLCSVFHPEGYVRERLTRDFDVLDFIPEGALGNPRQDAWLFRKRG